MPSIRCLVLFLLGLGGGRLTASSYDYAYGSMAHHDERSRENALARTSNYSPNSGSSNSAGAAFDRYIAQRRENDRQQEQRQYEQRRYDQQNAGTGNNLLDNFNKYKRLHPEEFTERTSISTAVNTAPTRNDDQRFFDQTFQRAQGGSVNDMNMLGYIYHEGKPGVPADRGQALVWYEKAATAGHPNALNWAWYMNNAGDGVPVNKERALFWRRKAADAGDSGAERDIGERLLAGDGMPRDPAAGIRYLEQSAAHGDAYAGQDLIAACTDHKSPVFAPEKAQRLLRPALVKAAGFAFYDNLDLQLKLWAEAGLNKTQINAELVSLFKTVAPTSEKISSWLGVLFGGRGDMQRDDTLAVGYYEFAGALGNDLAFDRAFSLASDKSSTAYNAGKALGYLRQLLAQHPDQDFSRYAFEFRRLTRETGMDAATAETELRQLLTLAVKTRPAAGYCLAQLLDESASRLQDAAAIVEFYRQAAAQPPGDCQAAAALRLYELYHTGDLVPADAVLAISYLQRADDANKEVALYKAGVALRDGAKPEPAAAFFKFSDRGFYEVVRTPILDLMRRAALSLLKTALAEAKDPADLIAMLQRVRFGDEHSELAVWAAEEEIRVAVRFPDFSDSKKDDAERTLRHAAENGHSSAYHWLAVSEARVFGPTESSLEYAQKGADAGDLACKNLLGLWRWETSQGKDQSCVALLEEAVAGGVDDALFNLARVYEVGDAPLRDEAKARALYARAAGAGISAAKRRLGTMWAEGRGGGKDQAKGLALLREAAVDDRGAAYLLGSYLISGTWGEHNAVAGCEFLKSALAMGEWRAGIELAWTYHNGVEVPADDLAARRSLLEAGEKAIRDRFTAEAHQQIGEAFWYGTCVPADPAEAMRWMSEGPEAVLAFRMGKGVKQSVQAANFAAVQLEKQGDCRGTLELGEIALLEEQAVEARHYFERAAQAGSVRALQRLADCWTSGIGGPIDPKIAQLCRQAALRSTAPQPAF